MVADGGYVGLDVHRAARIAAAGHGGQVLVSGATAASRRESSYRPRRAPFQGYVRTGTGLSARRPHVPAARRASTGRTCPFRRRRSSGASTSCEFVDLLTGEDARLVTLTGPGGSGKTRLALQAAAEASERHPGRCLLDLTRSAPRASNSRAGVRACARGPRAAGSHRRTRWSGLRLKAGAHRGRQLRARPGRGRHDHPRASRVPARGSSSRRRVASAWVFGPSTSTRCRRCRVGRERLFVERASAVSPGFRADRHVRPSARRSTSFRSRSSSPRRAYGPSRPARSGSISPRASASSPRDRDVDARQRTLEATIEWSYDLLDDEERRVLRSLSVFAGGCTLAAAEAVAGADLDAIESLLDKSLIRHRIDKAGNDRYWLLETIREYAASRLSLTGEAEQADARHTEFFLSMRPNCW